MDPNDDIAISTTRSALRRAVEAAWHDSAAQTADRLFAILERQDEDVASYVGLGPCLSGTWTHLFAEDGAQVERSCLVVVDQAGRLLALTVLRDGKQRDPSAAERADVQDALDDNDVASDPGSYDLIEEPLPAWARVQIAEAVEAAR